MKVAVIQPNVFSYSETFIRNHIQYLKTYHNAEVHDLAGGWVPYMANGQRLAPRVVVLMEKIISKILLREYVYLIQARIIRKYLRDHNIDVVLCEFGQSGVAMGPICQELGIPFVVHFFGLDLHGKKIMQRYGEGYRKMFSTAHAIIAISTLQKQILSDMGCPESKMRHIVCGANDTLLTPARTRLGDYFLSVGRLVEKKGPLYLLQAFNIVAKAHPAAQLIMVGNGKYREQCETFIRNNNLQENIQMLLEQSHDKVYDLMRNAFCFVQHSVTSTDGDSEGTPVAILESGMAGLPVVSTLHAGIKDVVADQKTGYLVPERDVEGMAKWMIYLLEHPEYALEMGKLAQQHVASHFSLKITIGKLYQTLEDARAGV